MKQDFSEKDTFQCGYSEIGYDLYYKDEVNEGGGGECEQGDTIDGEKYCYATMHNLIFATDLQKLLKDVDDGTKQPGTYAQPYPYSYDHIVDGCTATYKVDFRIPAPSSDRFID